jgi:hypothetical protein
MVSQERGESTIKPQIFLRQSLSRPRPYQGLTLVMAPTAPSNSKPKKGQNPAGGVGKERPKEKTDAKTLLDQAKAQEREIQEQQDPDAMVTDKRERDQAKADKVAGSLFVQVDDQTQETVGPLVVSGGSY